MVKDEEKDILLSIKKIEISRYALRIKGGFH